MSCDWLDHQRCCAWHRYRMEAKAKVWKLSNLWPFHQCWIFIAQSPNWIFRFMLKIRIRRDFVNNCLLHFITFFWYWQPGRTISSNSDLSDYTFGQCIRYCVASKLSKIIWKTFLCWPQKKNTGGFNQHLLCLWQFYIKFIMYAIEIFPHVVFRNIYFISNQSVINLYTDLQSSYVIHFTLACHYFALVWRLS